MAHPEPWRKITRLLDEIGTLQRKIVDGVRRTGASLGDVKLMERQIATRRTRIEVLKREYLSGLIRRPEIEGSVQPGESPMTVDEAMLIAETLRAQRPMIYRSEEWPAFRRVCASLAEFFSVRLAGAAVPFDAERFLIACGLTSEDSRRLSADRNDDAEGKAR